MANDRIYVKCDFCGAEQMLVKIWEGPEHIDWEHLIRFAGFFCHHSLCHPLHMEDRRNGIPGFSFVTESDELETASQETDPDPNHRNPLPTMATNPESE